MNGAGPSAPEPGDSRVVTTGGTMGSRALGSDIERHEVHGATHIAKYRLQIFTRTTVPTIAYGRSLRIEIFTLTGRGWHTTHHHKVPQREAHKHTENITQAARLAAESIS